ncbi:mucoidy inhibitor MuiA family protein [Candidatus Uabimicrobium sp. HlEnr_7]|uniref:mucoidy inhibitor MuiA family protein n=1 Tax=Candidatus Uabimicrobium helgolandensis TaxID=3095367 RepID=UPI003558840D
MNKSICIFLSLLCILHSETFEQHGKIEKVTLYRGQALVKRTVTVSTTPGQHQLIINDLPATIQSKSLFANASNDINIRSVRYTTAITADFPQETFRQLSNEQQELEKKVRLHQHQQNFIRTQEQYLAGLKNYTITATKGDIQKGSLNPTSMAEMLNYIFKESKRLNDEKLAISEQMISLKKQIAFIKNKMRQVSGQNSKEVKKAVIFFEKKNNGSNSQIHLNYLVNNATWSPAYNVRTRSSEKTINIEYNALVQQTSGENWDNVELTLSTASVEMSADAPALSIMSLELQNNTSAWTNDQVISNYTQFKNEQAKILKSRSKLTRSQQQQSNNNLNATSNNIQVLELLGSNQFRRQKMRTESVLTVHYSILGKVSIASRSDQQMVEIKNLTLGKEQYNITIPLLSEYVYRKAKITNSYESALLEGKANIYLNSQFVGHSFVPMTAKGQKFTIGLGIDTQLRASRELLSKKEYVQRGNKVITVSYRLSFENFKENVVPVRIYDRIPKSNENLNVVFKSATELSKETRYQKISKGHGILRWDVNIPEGKKLQTPYNIDYTLQLEFEKGMAVVAPFLQNQNKYQQKQRRKKYNKSMLEQNMLEEDFLETEIFEQH